MNQYFNFTEEDQLLPGTLIRAEQLNAFLQAIAVGFDGINGVNTQFISVPDGVDAVIDEPLALRRLRLVGFDQAGNISLFGVFRNEGNYTAAKSYVSNSLVKSGKNLYVVNRDFTATVFATDLANGNLSLLIDFESVISDARVAIKNEGVEITSGAEFLNFVGTNVQVSSDENGGVLVQILDQVITPTYPSVLDEGAVVETEARSINFAGAGVTASTDLEGNVTVTIPGGGSGGNPLGVQDEGIQIEDDALTLNFAGAGVTATSANGVVTVTIPGAGGGSSTIAVDDEGLELTDMLTRLNFVGGGVVATEASPGVIQVSIPGQVPITAANEGAQIEDDVKSINFVGAGVTATSDPSGNLTVSIPGGGGSGGGVDFSLSDEGVLIIQNPTDLNFTGDLVTVTDEGDGTARVRVLGPQVYDSPEIGNPGVLLKNSATKLEFGPNIQLATFGPDGRVFIDALVPPPSDFTVSDENSTVAFNPTDINFVGDGVTVQSDDDGSVTVSIPGGGAGGGSPLQVRDENSTVELDTTIFNFVGAGVTATSVAPGEVEINIPGGSAVGGIPLEIQDEGVTVEPDTSRINFVGEGVTATFDGLGNVLVDIPGTPAFTPLVVQDEGVTVEPETTRINFVGAGVTATFNGLGNVLVDIPGGAGGALNFFEEEQTTIQTQGNVNPTRTTRLYTSPEILDAVSVELLEFGLGNNQNTRDFGAFAMHAGNQQFVSATDGPAARSVQITPNENFARTKLGSVVIGDVRAGGKIGLDAVCIGNSLATADSSVAVGKASSFGSSSVSIGDNASTLNTGAVAIGFGADADSGVAIGRDSIAELGGTALGPLSVSTGGGSVALGNIAQAAGLGSISIGDSADALQTASIAIGADSISSASESISIGILSTAVATKGIAIGPRSEALSNGLDGAIAIGAGAKTGNMSISAVSLGNLANSRGQYSICVGHGSSVTDGSDDSIAIGRSATVEENLDFSVTIGRLSACQANASSSVTVGYISRSSAGNTTAVGQQTSIGTGATNSSAFGSLATIPANFQNSTALGNQATVNGSNQVQLGNAATTTYAYGAVQDRSDARDKTEVRDTQLGLDFIMSMRAVDFKWDYREVYLYEVVEIDENGNEQIKRVYKEKDGSKVRNRFHHGVIAQEVQDYIARTGKDFGGFKDGSIDGGEDRLTIGYTEFIGPLIKSIQEQQAQIEQLKVQIEELRRTPA